MSRVTMKFRKKKPSQDQTEGHSCLPERQYGRTARCAFNFMTSLALKRERVRRATIVSSILCDIGREVIYASTYNTRVCIMRVCALCDVLLSSSRILSSLSCRQDNVNPRERCNTYIPLIFTTSENGCN